MAKLASDVITESDISEYLESSSDFSFEIAVLRRLNGLGFSCHHGGTYEDPVTNRAREFDIRASKLLLESTDLELRIKIAVECKNIRSNFPLVFHCMPREEHESYLHMIWSTKPAGPGAIYSSPGRKLTLAQNDGPYGIKDPVGKSCDQVGRRRDGELLGNDSDVFEKVSQALNSSYDLVRHAHFAGNSKRTIATIVVPVLVIPEQRLWTVWYNKNGSIDREPTKEVNVEYYVGRTWSVPDSTGGQVYSLSHMEIVQIDAIAEMVRKYADLPFFSSADALRKKSLELRLGTKI